MAYYISFLKTLSLKLNNHTVHFFYNEVSGEQQVRGVKLINASMVAFALWRQEFVYKALMQHRLWHT